MIKYINNKINVKHRRIQAQVGQPLVLERWCLLNRCRHYHQAWQKAT